MAFGDAPFSIQFNNIHLVQTSGRPTEVTLHAVQTTTAFMKRQKLVIGQWPSTAGQPEDYANRTCATAIAWQLPNHGEPMIIIPRNDSNISSRGSANWHYRCGWCPFQSIANVVYLHLPFPSAHWCRINGFTPWTSPLSVSLGWSSWRRPLFVWFSDVHCAEESQLSYPHQGLHLTTPMLAQLAFLLPQAISVVPWSALIWPSIHCSYSFSSPKSVWSPFRMGIRMGLSVQIFVLPVRVFKSQCDAYRKLICMILKGWVDTAKREILLNWYAACRWSDVTSPHPQ